MRDNLNGRTEIVTATLTLNDGRINAACRDVIRLARRNACEALIVAEIEVGFCAVIGDVDLAMLTWAHRSGIDVKIRVKFTQSDFVAPRLKQCPKRRGRDTFAQRGHHAASNENIASHGIADYPIRGQAR